jgi:hypothetical protein
MPTSRKVRRTRGGLGDKVIALLTDARADPVEVAIDKTGASGMFDRFINNIGAAIPKKSRRQPSRNSPHDRH